MEKKKKKIVRFATDQSITSSSKNLSNCHIDLKMLLRKNWKNMVRSWTSISERENKNWLSNKEKHMRLLQKWIERKQIYS